MRSSGYKYNLTSPELGFPLNWVDILSWEEITYVGLYIFLQLLHYPLIFSDGLSQTQFII